MNNGKFVSVKTVANRLMQNPLMTDLSWEFIVSNALECMRILGTPAMFYTDKKLIDIKDYKGSLPTNYIKVNSVSRVTKSGLQPMITSEDVLHSHYDVFSKAPEQNGKDTYSFNKNKIFTNFKDGQVLMVFQTIATDEECYPMFPNNAELGRAIRTYIKWQWFDILHDMDKISLQKVNKAETDYCFNAGQAQSDLQMPSEDEMEALVNSITQILPSRNQHSERFQYLGQQEFLRVQ